MHKDLLVARRGRKDIGVNHLASGDVSSSNGEGSIDLRAMHDDELALAVKGGEESAFDELVRRHQGRVYAVAYRITLNREDALDVAQEALVKAYRKIDAWKPHGGFVPWLMRLTANHAIDCLRRKKRRKESSADESYGPHQTVDHSPLRDTGTAVLAQEINERIDGALGCLSPSQRAVFVMRHYEGLPLADIAEALTCTVGSVKVHLFRALRKLRVELADLYEGE
jgi:RNA polymerase sigma-70 factor (ECF subfamily)